MRFYHFTSAEHALDNLRYRRLKIATFNDLNDPFELWAATQPRALRRGFRDWKKEIADKFGVLCFSKTWHNPLLWSHYAERHHGIALGFDINKNIIKDVNYSDERPQFHRADIPTLHALLYTKYRDWQYEHESRIFTTLNERDRTNGLFFGQFNEHVVLREVITGPLCITTKAEIEEALRDKNVIITKARLAYKTFTVVKNRQGFRKNGSC